MFALKKCYPTFIEGVNNQSNQFSGNFVLYALLLDL
uniref:Uncharacterized protein n=1 Tax=Anguilla anguilla TaxID=7936 RepID=A0A0E9SXW6_ANGAN